MRKLTLSIASLAAAMLSSHGTVSAGTEIFDDTISSCTGLNCSSLRLPGTVLTDGPSAKPWVAQLHAPFGRCVRLQVISQETDLEMVVTAPDGSSVFWNDDGFIDPVPFAPVVKIASAPKEGWYTVRLSEFVGMPVDKNFVLLYGVYAADNPNCADATTPLTLMTSAPIDPLNK
jgi:hypothetical protein